MPYAEGYGSDSRLYRIWINMRVRCRYPKDKCYHLYGGRGIKVCEKWDKSYPVFRDWAIENGYSDTLTIDRIDPNGDYCPENCRWATAKEQSVNRRNSVLFNFNGKKLTIGQIAEIIGVNESTLRSRYYHEKENKDLFATKVQFHSEPAKSEEEKEMRKRKAALDSYYRNIEKCRERAREYQRKKRERLRMLKNEIDVS